MAKFSLLDKWSPQLLSVLRIVVAFLFFWHGSAKILHYPPPGMGELPMLITIAGLLEMVGSVLLFLGLFTKPAAFILSGEMAFAYFMAHFKASWPEFLPYVNHGEAAVYYCFTFLYLAAAGGGPWSLDHKLMKH